MFKGLEVIIYLVSVPGMFDLEVITAVIRKPFVQQFTP